jgi:hypothetical protein
MSNLYFTFQLEVVRTLCERLFNLISYLFPLLVAKGLQMYKNYNEITPFRHKIGLSSKKYKVIKL